MGQFREASSVGGVGGKFKERCAPHTEDSINCEARFDHNSSTRQFREVSSVGGVGRRCKEGSKSERVQRWQCWSRCWCSLLSLCHQRCTSHHPAKTRRCSHLVSSGKVLPLGASEESARKVPKASAYIAGSVGVDVGVRYCHCATSDEHPATLPNKERAHIWSVQGSFFLRGRRKKVRGNVSVLPEIPWEIRRGGNRSSEVSAGKFHPLGA